MAGSLTIPNIIFGLPGPTQPATVLDQNWSAIATYINAREITFGLAAAMPAVFVPGAFFFQTDTKQLYAGNGLIPTLISDELAVQNVFAFGAKGDGVNDDTGAIQNAINAGGVVYFPTPTVGYRITSALTLIPGVSLVGAGPDVTILAGANNFTMINFLTSAGTPLDFMIRNLTITGNGQTGITGISLDGNTSGMRLSQVWMEDVIVALCATGVKLRYCANVWMQNVFANTCVIGFQLIRCADVNMVDCMAQNGTGMGFDIIGDNTVFSEGLRMTGCSTNGQGGGLSSAGFDWAIVTGCSFTTTTTNVVALFASANWKFVNCEAAQGFTAFAGFVIDATCSNIQLMNCFIVLNTFGVACAASQFVISGCTFVGNGNVDIDVSSGGKHGAVTGNVCDSSGSAFSLAETGTANYNAATGNVMRGTLVWNINGNSVSSGNLQSYV